MRTLILGIGALGALLCLAWLGLRVRAIQSARDDVRQKQARQATVAGEMLEVTGFALDKTEVTVARYRECVKAGACTEPGRGELCNWDAKERDTHPINCVDHAQASAFCAWTGRRLPSAEEWELAACGKEGKKFAWPGEKSEGVECVDRDAVYAVGEGQRLLSPAKGTCPVDAHPEGATERGLLGMGGNVSEWTATESGEGPLPSNRWLNAGASWPYRRPDDLACNTRSEHAPTHRSALLGFRCAKSEPPSLWSELWDSEIQLARSSTTAMP